jgi:lysophospholipase L1-like esterase
VKKKLHFLLTLLTVLPVMAQQASPTPVAPPQAPSPKPTLPPRTQESAITPDSTKPKLKERHAAFLLRKNQGEIDLLFLGDSITDAWPNRGKESWAKFAPYHPADFGVSGDCTEHVLWRITNGELDGINPKVVVILIGTNNTGHYPDEKPEWTAAGIKKIVEIVHQKLPNAKVLLLAIFPRGANSQDANRLRNDEVNKLIAGLDDGDKTRYLDIGHVFLTPDGQLSKDIMPDHLHPSQHGYDLWYDAMQPTLDQMMK